MTGLIGIGLLGRAIAERLHAAGFELCGWDVNPAAVDFIARKKPAEIAADCDRIVLCLPNSDVVATVVREIRPTLRPDSVLIDTTTGSPQAVEKLAREGLQILDACVGGSSEDVRRNRALIMCGGDPALFQSCRPVLDAIAPSVFHVGAAGAGTRLKLVFNLVLGLNRAVLAEGLAFAEKSGIPRSDALQVLQQGAAYSRVMDTKGQKMVDGNFEPQARLSQHLKDVRQILEEGSANGALLPLSLLHEKLLRETEAAGFGAEDNSAILRWFQGLS